MKLRLFRFLNILDQIVSLGINSLIEIYLSWIAQGSFTSSTGWSPLKKEESVNQSINVFPFSQLLYDNYVDEAETIQVFEDFGSDCKPGNELFNLIKPHLGKYVCT